jgi:ABC-type transporter Mla MlaB component
MKKKSSADGVTGYPRTAHPRQSRRSSAPIKLPPELGIEQADNLRETLMKRLGDAKRVTLDASEIQRIHTAALQLFCMFCRDRRAAGHDTTWHQPSEVLRSAAALLGATTLLSLGHDQELA